MPALHRHTPTLAVSDPRCLVVRLVDYCRANDNQIFQQRINRTAYDMAGRTVAQWDPRLWALRKNDTSVPANLENVHSMSGALLSSQSVDAGVRIELLGEAGLAVQKWDGRGALCMLEYDSLLRPVALFEQARCTERYLYGTAQPAFADHNQCSQLIRHDDPAGTRHFNEFGLTGTLHEQAQYFLHDLDSPNWPLPINERNELLEPGDGASSVFHFNALNELLEQTDAQGNRQRFNQTVDGKLRDSWLHLKNAAAPQQLLSSIDYNANGQIERQTSGNGVISLFDYCPTDDRLIRLRAHRANHEPLQHLNYHYDPVGNILSIEDKALPIRYFANQRIEPINRYEYDSLSQLIQSTGWEAGSANRGPSQIDDPKAVANYQQTYRYDAGGNLLELIHHGPQRHGRILTAAKYSNRCLPEQDGRPPTEAELAAAFDENGNLLYLEKGRMLSWDVRNQLQQVCPVERESQLNDTERYIYSADGLRQRKIRSVQTNVCPVISETRYLPGLEIRRVNGETLHVITAQVGRTTVQVLHWESAPPPIYANDQFRYNLADHLGSFALELDREAKVISRETYHPFGSTAFSDWGDSSEVSYRTLHYSGKERDATGLNYYGLRYYIPWLQRWSNSDPAGYIDGPNLYRMVRNNPIMLIDSVGKSPINPNKTEPQITNKNAPTTNDIERTLSLNNLALNGNPQHPTNANTSNDKNFIKETETLGQLIGSGSQKDIYASLKNANVVIALFRNDTIGDFSPLYLAQNEISNLIKLRELNLPTIETFSIVKHGERYGFEMELIDKPIDSEDIINSRKMIPDEKSFNENLRNSLTELIKKFETLEIYVDDFQLLIDGNGNIYINDPRTVTRGSPKKSIDKLKTLRGFTFNNLFSDSDSD